MGIKEAATRIYNYLLDAPQGPASKDSQRATEVMRKTAQDIEEKVKADLHGIQLKRNPQKRG